jgi:hypothetical protein
VDLGWRFWLLGGRSVTAPAARAYHRFGASSSKSGDLRERLGERHNIRALLKNYGAQRAALNLGRLISLRRPAGLWWRLLTSLGWNGTHSSSTWRERRRIQAQRRVADRALDRLILDCDGTAAIVPSYRIAMRQDFTAVGPPEQLVAGGETGALGYGWHPSEKSPAGILRWSAFEAQLFLACSRGRRAVALDLVAPPAGPACYLELLLDDNSLGTKRIQPGSSPSIEFPLPPDCGRILDLRLRASPTWTPHELFGNRDLRTLGIGLRAARLRS